MKYFYNLIVIALANAAPARAFSVSASTGNILTGASATAVKTSSSDSSPKGEASAAVRGSTGAETQIGKEGAIGKGSTVV